MISLIQISKKYPTGSRKINWNTKFHFSAIEKSSFTHYDFSDSHEKELLSLEITHCFVLQLRQDW